MLCSMLRRFNLYLDSRHFNKLTEIAKTMTPGTKASMLVRQAIAEFIERKETEKEKGKKQK